MSPGEYTELETSQCGEWKTAACINCVIPGQMVHSASFLWSWNCQEALPISFNEPTLCVYI